MVDDLFVAVRRAAKAGAGQDDVADQQEVALALVDLDGLAHVEAVGAEPVHVGGAFGLALRVGELGAVGDAVDDEAAVGGVDHVGQAVDRVDQVHVEAEADVGVVQRLPLGDGQVRVGRQGRVHPRVDPVDDGEVVGLAHQDGARHRRASDRDGRHRLVRGSGCDIK